MPAIILFNKPYGVLSQFTDNDGHPGLANYVDAPAFYPAGRLDRDSEGLLLLTNDGTLQAQISHPRFKLPKTYIAQVEGIASEDQLQALREGISLSDGPARPALAKLIAEPDLWPRNPPVRFRKTVPTSWVEITISEGRNRQVRRMTAAAGLPTLRLIRWSIGDWQLASLAPGEHRLEEVSLPRHNSGEKSAAKHRVPRNTQGQRKSRARRNHAR